MRRNVGRKPQTSANLAAFLHIIDTSRLLEILKGDSSAIIHAAAKAEQAFSYLKAFGSSAASERPEVLSEDTPALKRAA